MSYNLRNVDILDGLKDLDEHSIDLVVTSPPYNIGTKYQTYKDAKRAHEYGKWVFQWSRGIKRVLREDGNLFLNVGYTHKEPLVALQVLQEFITGGWLLQNTIHWVKSVTVRTPLGDEMSVGHFKPINSPCYLNGLHEYVFHLTPTGRTQINRLAIGVPYQDQSNAKRWKGKHTKRCRGNVWFVPYETIQRRIADRPHPATFPPELAQNCIRLAAFGDPKLIRMLDPFVGIGSSAIAAAREGVGEFTGFDIDKDYIAYAEQWLKETNPSL